MSVPPAQSMNWALRLSPASGLRRSARVQEIQVIVLVAASAGCRARGGRAAGIHDEDAVGRRVGVRLRFTPVTGTS